jgi:hypothetical protein
LKKLFDAGYRFATFRVFYQANELTEMDGADDL